LLAGETPASNFEPVEMTLCAGGWLAGHLNDRQHKSHQRWRLLKQPASTNAISAGGFLGRPLAQNSSLMAVA
jgi:hypothetical protein